MFVKIVSGLACYFIIVGIALLGAGEAAGLPVLILSILWLVYRSKAKRKAATGPDKSEKKAVTDTHSHSPIPDRCPHCGAKTSADFAFCETCGHKLT